MITAWEKKWCMVRDGGEKRGSDQVCHDISITGGALSRCKEGRRKSLRRRGDGGDDDGGGGGNGFEAIWACYRMRQSLFEPSAM